MKFLVFLALLTASCATSPHRAAPASAAPAEMLTDSLALFDGARQRAVPVAL
ncbi:hypothetical protein [Hymenobacter nivis]|uniref:hypothetical protein n=1 Tax=Hymenobacter nivis TaxID=1850093 RepID=UPI0013A54AB5|nr:hypothetical protein [Hymenobacter nivis]